MINKRISNRVYLSIECRQCKRPFNPSDARQVFCNAQHRIDYNNDQRKIKTADLDLHNKALINNERILKKIFESLKRLQKDSVGIDILKYEGFSFHIYNLSTIRGNTQIVIYWSLSYGIEIVNENQTTFKIIKAVKQWKKN